MKPNGTLFVNGRNLGSAYRDPATGNIEAGPHVVDAVCEHCDQPFGDTERADNHPAVKEWLAWTSSGRKKRAGPRPIWKEVVAAVAADQPGKHTELTCFRINWRDEAIRLRVALVEAVDLAEKYAADSSLAGAKPSGKWIRRMRELRRSAARTSPPPGRES